MDKSTQEKECISRMKNLGFSEEIIHSFEQGIVFCSHPFGFSSPLTEEVESQKNAFEEKTNCMVFHVIHSFSNFGELYDFLYVSSYKEDWECERSSLKEGYPIAYSCNKTHPTNSEHGTIKIEKINELFFRTA